MPSTSEQERARRRAAVAAARHSSALEGARSSDQAHQDQDAYARGELTIDELLERVKAAEGRGR